MNPNNKLIECAKFNLSKAILDKLSPDKFICTEIAEAGACGLPGDLCIYTLKNRDLVRYQTNLFDNKHLYLEAERLIITHQNHFEHDFFKSNEILFNYYYVGLGNHVFANKRIKHNKDEDFLTIELEGDIYTIHLSILSKLRHCLGRSKIH